jgi:tetratricopeptide (TPR) repeat protein
LLGYSIDAFFNFPQERPSSQIFFVFFAALNLLSYHLAIAKTNTGSEKPAKGNSKEIFGFIVIILTFPAAYYTLFSYLSLVAQDKILSDLASQPPKLTINEVRNLYYDVPNLCFTSRSMDEIVGKYYYENKKYDQAIKYLDKGSAASPYVMYSEFLKSKVYYDMNQMDSAFKYANMAFFNRPRVKDFYQTLIAVSLKKGDSATIANAFRLFSKYRPNDPDAWNLYIKGSFYIKNIATPSLIAAADSALKLFPANKELTDTRNELMNSKK